MASLCKRAKSPYWYCCYTAADGRRLKKSTEETVRSKALEIGLALERTERLAASGTLTETRARELIGEVLERTSGEALPFYTAEAWLREWLRGKEISKAAGTVTGYKHTVDTLISYMGKRAHLNIAAITPKDISGFRDAQIASGKHPHTVRDLIKRVRIPFNAARRQGIITHNPAEAVELPGRVKTEEGAESGRDVFTPEQISSLMEAAVSVEHEKPVFEAGGDWQDAIRFGYFTGARLQDVANMTWNCVDLPRKLLTYRARKTGRMVVIPLHEQLEDHLLKLPAPENGSAFLFPKLAGKNTGGRSGLSMTFSRIMARAEIEGAVLRKAEKGGKGRSVRSLTFHSLRHSYNSAMANAGHSQEIRMKLTGHDSPDMNALYTHLDIDALRPAIASIPRLP